MSSPAATAPAAMEHSYPKNKWTIAAAVTVGTLMGTIDTSIINVALPHLRGTLSATVEEISWVSTGYIVASVIIMPLTAWLGSRFGRKRIYMLGLVTFIIGSMLCGMARTLWPLVFFRILQGIGAGALQPTEQAILRETFPPEEQGQAMALYGFAIMLGPAIGPTLGGYIVDNYSWPWIFYLNVPVGLIGLVAVWRVVEDPPYLVRTQGKVDWGGIALLVLGLAALQTLLEQGEAHDWFGSRLNVLYLCVAVSALVMFVVWELTTRDPAVELRVMRDRTFTLGTIIGSLLGVVLFASLFLLPIYMQELLGFDAMQSGLALLPRSIAMLITIPIVGKIYNRTSPRLVIAIGLVLGGVSCIQMSWFTLDTGTWQILGPQVVQGIGLACIFIPLSTVTLATIQRHKMSQATGLYNLIRQVGGSFGIAIFASLLSRFTTRNHSLLVSHLVDGDPAVMARIEGAKHLFMAHGSDTITATQQAYRLLDGMVSAQAAMLGFERTFFIAGLLFFVSIPILLLLDEGRGGGTHSGDHIAVEI